MAPMHNLNLSSKELRTLGARWAAAEGFRRTPPPPPTADHRKGLQLIERKYCMSLDVEGK